MRKECLISGYLLFLLYFCVFFSPDTMMRIKPYPQMYICVIGGGLLLLFMLASRTRISSVVQSVTSKLFMCGISILSLIQALIGVVQYFEIYNLNENIIGSFTNVVYYVSFLGMTIPIILHLMCSMNKLLFRVLLLIILFCCLTAIFLSKSRTAILSVIIMLVIWGFNRFRISSGNIRYKLMFYFVGGFSLLSVVLITINANNILALKNNKNIQFVNQKTLSLCGRVLILQISYEMIKHKLIFGYGYNGFEKYYMDYQAHYFKCHDLDEKTKYLADDIDEPLNVFIKTTINYGLFGLFILIITMSFILRKINSVGICREMLQMMFGCFFVFMLFSYPFNNAVVIFLLFLYGSLLVIDISHTKYFYSQICWTISLLLCSSCLFFSMQFYYQFVWANIVDQYSNIIDKSKISEYDNLYRYKKNNPYFLYNYAFCLYEVGSYEDSYKALLRSFDLKKDYESLHLYAEVMLKLKNYDEALKIYSEMSYMIPCRFMPLFGLFNTYIMMGEKEKALFYAKQISKKQIKIMIIRNTD